jgi:metallophosphoesterase superfamily enzyme
MVAAAIAALKEKKGSSRAAIKKYIAANYKVDIVKLVVYDLHLGKHHTLYFPNEQKVMFIPLLKHKKLLLEHKKLTNKSRSFVVYDLHLGKHHTLYFPNEQEVMFIPLLEHKKLTNKSRSFVIYDLHLGKHHTLYFPNEQEAQRR